MPTDHERIVSSSSVFAPLCADCRYFRLVALPSGRSRALCSLTGEKLAKQGAPLCEFCEARGGDNAA